VLTDLVSSTDRRAAAKGQDSLVVTVTARVHVIFIITRGIFDIEVAGEGRGWVSVYDEIHIWVCALGARAGGNESRSSNHLHAI
jgi:hypothetical protein